MISKLLLFFIFIVPIFGKNLDSAESIIFYSIPSIILLFLFFKKQKLYLSTKNILIQTVLIILFLVSTIFSKNIGSSYYQFFVFLNSALIFSLAVNIINPKDFTFGLIISSLIYSLIFLLNKCGFLPINQEILSDNFILQNWGHSYVSELIILPIPFLLNKIFFEKKTSYLLIFLIIFISLFLSGSRSALVALIIGVLFLNFPKKINHRIKISFIILCSLGLIFNFYKINQDQQAQKSYTGDRVKYWQQAIQGFIESPIIGNGPNTFSYINKKFQTEATLTTSYTHNSFLNFLSENGAVFTIIIFFLIIKSLIKTSKINNPFFVCGLISTIYSLIDFNWNSPGIFAISLYLIFYFSLNKKINKKTEIYLLPISIIILLFTISKITSDFFFLKQDYQKSLKFDPFNLNSRLEIIKTNTKDQFWQKILENTLKIYNNNIILYQELTNIFSISEKPEYYYQLINLNPKAIDIGTYIKVANTYENLDNQKFNKILINLNNVSINSLNNQEKKSLAKYYYHYALRLFLTDPEKSIFYFKKSVYLIPTLGHFHIELANAYWNTNQKNKAINELDICQQYPDSKQQCQEYLSDYQKTNFNLPGKEDFIDYIDNNF